LYRNQGILPTDKGMAKIRIKPRFFLVVLVLLLLGILASSFIRNYAKIRHLRAEIERIEHEIHVMGLRNGVLLDEIALLEDDETVEEIARRELGLVKPGETVYRIADPLESDE
jgi:cell division protein FtsB